MAASAIASFEIMVILLFRIVGLSSGYGILLCRVMCHTVPSRGAMNSWEEPDRSWGLSSEVTPDHAGKGSIPQNTLCDVKWGRMPARGKTRIKWDTRATNMARLGILAIYENSSNVRCAPLWLSRF